MVVSRYFSDEKFRARVKAQHAKSRAAYLAMPPEEKAQHRARLKAAVRFNKFRLTKEAEAELLEFQRFRCAICETLDPGVADRAWPIDHDHKTGRVRGLLCRRCNTTLGHVNDDVNILFAMAEYLLESRDRNSDVRKLLSRIVSKIPK